MSEQLWQQREQPPKLALGSSRLTEGDSHVQTHSVKCRSYAPTGLCLRFVLISSWKKKKLLIVSLYLSWMHISQFLLLNSYSGMSYCCWQTATHSMRREASQITAAAHNSDSSAFTSEKKKCTLPTGRARLTHIHHHKIWRCQCESLCTSSGEPQRTKSHFLSVMQIVRIHQCSPSVKYRSFCPVMVY